MRLKDSEVQAIRRAVSRHFEPQARVYLFGSRVDDTRKGGDIDLFIKTRMQGTELLQAKLKTMSDIQRAIGDRKIDIVAAAPEPDRDVPLIVSKAQEQGIPL
ncbi:MAG: nucleotidyltransferase domain-containing protein [Desulfovermiculus sp.]